MRNNIFKKVVAFILAALITLPCISASAQTVVATGSCGKSATFTIYSDGTMRITGEGAISNDSDNPYWGAYGDMIKHIYVDGSIGVANRDSFARLENLETVEFGEGFYHLGTNVFFNCLNLKKVTFPESIFVVSEDAFANNYELSEIHFKGDEIPAGVYGHMFRSNSYKLSVFVPQDCFDSYLNVMMDYVFECDKADYPAGQPISLFTEGFSAQISDFDMVLEPNEMSEQLTITSAYPNLEISWHSVDKSIATVDSNGVVSKGEKHGTTTVYALINYGGHSGVLSCCVRNQRNGQLVDLLPTEGIEADFPTSYLIRTYDYLHGENELIGPGIFVENDLSRSYYQDILNKTAEVTRNCKTDLEKAEAIMDFVHEYIEYGGPVEMGTTISQIYQVYKNRLAHCQGYTYLTGLMLYQCGIPNAAVQSRAHMWNLALIDGKWIQIDSTNGWFNEPYDYSDYICQISFANDNATYLVTDLDGVKFASVGSELAENESITEFVIPDFADIILTCATNYAPNLKTTTVPKTIKKIYGTPFKEKDREYNVIYQGSEQDWLSIDFSHGSQKLEPVIINGKSVSFKEQLQTKNIDIIANGNFIYPDTAPVIVNGRTLVPVRAIGEFLKAEVLWNESTKTVTLIRNNNTVEITIGSSSIKKNGKKIKIDCAAQIMNNRTMLPVRAITEAFGADVNWNEGLRIVEISDYYSL